MDNTKFTKGKWEFNKENFIEIQIKNPLKSICAINTNVEEYEFNALLISKSPILLQAIYDSIEPLKKAGLKEMADYHEKIYLDATQI